MDMFVLLTVQLDNSITKQLRHVLAQPDKTGTEISVFIAMEVKLGTQPKTPVSVQLKPYGTDIHAMIHAMVEEFSTPQVDNVFAPQETGMEDHVLFVQTLKLGAVHLWFVFVQVETGTVLLVFLVLLTKCGIPLL
jgi:hypothetical protein